eukprot:g15004.t1
MKGLSLGGNKLSGHIPKELGALSKLQTLWLSSNELVGSLPKEIAALAELRGLGLSYNKLRGTIPRELGKLTALTELHIHRNNLSGGPRREESLSAWKSRLQAELADLEQEKRGRAEESRNLLGPSPSLALTDRDILVILYRSTDGPNWKNKTNWDTDGPLAERYGVAVNHQGRVVKLSLVSNNLRGHIPRELGALSKLQALVLSKNELVGPIPKELGTLPELKALGLSINKLSGSIPPELGNLAALRVLSVSNNQLSGPLPPELGKLAALQTLHYSEYELTGGPGENESLSEWKTRLRAKLAERAKEDFEPSRLHPAGAWEAHGTGVSQP